MKFEEFQYLSEVIEFVPILKKDDSRCRWWNGRNFCCLHCPKAFKMIEYFYALSQENHRCRVSRLSRLCAARNADRYFSVFSVAFRRCENRCRRFGCRCDDRNRRFHPAQTNGKTQASGKTLRSRLKMRKRLKISNYPLSIINYPLNSEVIIVYQPKK